jgi:glycosyltransferase involved in cell wall biosynthesis
MKKRLHVLTMPDFRTANPYQVLLSEALHNEGVQLVFSEKRPGKFPLVRTWLATKPRPPILHLHWIIPYLRGSTIATQFLYAAMLLTDVLLLRLAGVRIVWTVHNLLMHESRWPQLELQTRALLARLCHRLIVHSNAAANAVSRAYHVPSAKISVIQIGSYPPPAVYTGSKSEARRKLGFPADTRLYVALGHLRPYKGIEELLTVWRENFIDAEAFLAIAGQASPDHAEKLRRLADGIPNVHLVSTYIPDDDVAAYLAAADVAIAPFRRVLTSSSVVQYLCAGLPVIAPAFPVLSETLEGADQLLYDPENSAGLALSIQKSLQSDTRLLSESACRAAERFRWEATAAQTARVFRSLRS